MNASTLAFLVAVLAFAAFGLVLLIAALPYLARALDVAGALR